MLIEATYSKHESLSVNNSTLLNIEYQLVLNPTCLFKRSLLTTMTFKKEMIGFGTSLVTKIPTQQIGQQMVLNVGVAKEARRAIAPPKETFQRPVFD